MATERYHPLFASDLAAACSYYDSIAEMLGNRFRGNVRSIIQTVVERPESFGRIGGDFAVRWFIVSHMWLSSLTMTAFLQSSVCDTLHPTAEIGLVVRCR
jgi:hypothetical protein